MVNHQSHQSLKDTFFFKTKPCASLKEFSMHMNVTSPGPVTTSCIYCWQDARPGTGNCSSIQVTINFFSSGKSKKMFSFQNCLDRGAKKTIFNWKNTSQPWRFYVPCLTEELLISGVDCCGVPHFLGSLAWAVLLQQAEFSAT